MSLSFNAYNNAVIRNQATYMPIWSTNHVDTQQILISEDESASVCTHTHQQASHAKPRVLVSVS